jgi:hypothetical protein
VICLPSSDARGVMIPTSVVPSVSGWGPSSLVASMVKGHPGLVMPDDLSPSLVMTGMGNKCLHVFISQGDCTFICPVFAFSSVIAVRLSCQHSLCFFFRGIGEGVWVVVFIRE